MQLTVLGCAGTFPGPDSACSSYLVEHAGYRLLLDAGYGAIGALQRHAGLFDVDAVLLSHLHGDHCLDLVAYAYARLYHPTLRPPRIPVLGPVGTEQRLLGATETDSPDLLSRAYDFQVVHSGEYRVGPFTVSLARMAHPVECYGARVTAGGRTLAYSADTGACDALVTLARDADLFLCEAAYDDGRVNPPAVHLTGAEAAQHAARAGVQRLLLTHLVAWGDREATLRHARAHFPGAVALAAAGSTYSV